MSDLAWAKAAKLLKLDHAAGWPRSLNLQRLAVLQTGWGTKEQRDEVNAIITTMLHACKVGTIDHTTKNDQVTVRTAKSVTVGTSPLMGGAKVIYTQPAEFKIVTSHHIGAPAFAAWLADQGLTASDLVAAWFKAMGTARAPDKPAHPLPGVNEGRQTTEQLSSRILKQSNLISEVQRDWPSIERDLREASRNGLKDAAYSKAPRGWSATKARSWAEVNGKLSKTPIANDWPGKVHKIRG